MFRTWLALIAGAALLPAMASAQTRTGAIGGVVKDDSGGAIPGAAVKVLNEDTGVTRDVFSDDRGAYRAAALAAGRYLIETMLDGFETAVSRTTVDAGHVAAIDITLRPARFVEGVVVTARRVEEAAQEVPIPLSVVSGNFVDDAGAFNVNRLKELIPTVQFYSTNPRNSAINIRGLGAPFGLTNDGVEPGVGLYIDGVFFARPASASLDFLDVERIEVLRGPQGTLFGKNTTAGAINVTTRKPSFTPETSVELNYGNLGFVQAKASVTGPLASKAAGRLSFSGTQREGTVYNVKTRHHVNDLDNLGVRGQILAAPSDTLAVLWTTDSECNDATANVMVNGLFCFAANSRSRGHRFHA
jgi:iron complex outermembrane recepter protein